MTLHDIKQLVISKLDSLPVCVHNSSNTQFQVRCPYCGDSKNILHGHLSVKVNPNDDSICIWRCFKCNESGILTSQVMEDLGVPLEMENAKSLDVINRPNSKSTYGREKPLKYTVPEVFIPSANIDMKLEYLYHRLGIEFTENMVKESKIILSIVDFFAHNKMKLPEHINPNLYKIIEENYVGFLSANNNKMIFRRVTDKEKLNRYIKLSIDPYNTSPNNFYSLLNQQIDLLYTDPVHVHIAEGTFDILSIRYNLSHDFSQKHLFYAACGYNFGTILKWLIFMGVNTDIIIHMYSDNDKSDTENIKVLNTPLNKCWIDTAYIHRNLFENEKDFGVPIERIKNSFIKVK